MKKITKKDSLNKLGFAEDESEIIMKEQIVFSEDYRAFSTGKSDVKENQERLFLCTCDETKKEVIPSALNYTGGKYKLLPQILPLFPEDVNEVVDLFCGGCNVGINVKCNKVQFNDSNEYLVGLLNVLKKLPKEEVFSWIFEAIQKYELSLTSRMGYEYYGCESSKGLSSYNKTRFNKLREDFNKKKEKDDEYFLMLYLLIVYSFNNQLQFNRKGEFNMPVGKRDFNSKMQKKLGDFIDRIKSGDYRFTNDDFRTINIDDYTDKSFFYVDPPYLITCATYNERGGWSEQDEYDLLSYLERLNEKGIRFALSNVIESKGKKNKILENWIEKKNFTAIPLDYNYSNCNYHTKQRDSITREILVVNY